MNRVIEKSKMNNQLRRGSLTPLSMSRTLWSTERPIQDSRSTSTDHDNGVNVQVIVRCRPHNEDEMLERTHQVISCDEFKNQVIINNKQIERTFEFDKVLGSETQQKDLYNEVMTPLVSEVLEGYSWTVFAYGQTGTGKSYTMEGETRKEKNGELHKNAGVIPRAVQQVFKNLESSKADYSMRVTFLELYNEEVTDLLASDDKPKRNLVLMDDGKGSVFVRGCEEEIVSSADEIYAILERGTAKKHIAQTLLNKQSNRSHSIFSITIHIKELNSDGSEMIKCGKLNLVDLAGSENILRSGAKELRAREAGEINKSLLTLGRVITALADQNSAHVPYRESKLTRLLRDSLGGKTKTCMIATISPSIISLDETLSTFDYALRAKRIKNTPEVNYNIKHYVNKELHAAVEENGVHVLSGHQESEAATKKLMELQELYLYQQQLMEDLRDQFENTKIELRETRQSLFNLEAQYQQEKDVNQEKEKMIFHLIRSGKELTEVALELRSELESASSDVYTLFSGIELKKYLEDENKQHIQKAYSRLALQLEEIEKIVSVSVTQHAQTMKLMQDNVQSFFISKAEVIQDLMKQIERLKSLYGLGIKQLDDSAQELCQNSQQALCSLNLELSNQYACMMSLVTKVSSDADTISKSLKNNLIQLGSRISAFMKQQEEIQIRNYETSKSFSESFENFYKTLNLSISKLRFMEEDPQTITTRKLNAFTNKFEEFAAAEERLILKTMGELLASSTSRKKIMVKKEVADITESACKERDKIYLEAFNMEKFMAEAKENWDIYVERSKKNLLEDTASIESNKNSLEDTFKCCIAQSKEIAGQQKMAEESLLYHLKKNTDLVDSLAKKGTEVNESIYTRLSSVASSVLEETDNTSKSILPSAENLMRLDNEASNKISLVSAHCIDGMKEMNSIHSQRNIEILETFRKSLIEDYMVDDSDMSRVKRTFYLPSKESILNFLGVHQCNVNPM